MSRVAFGDRVLLRMPSWLGDFVMAEPVARAAYERAVAAGDAASLSLAAPRRFLALLDGRYAGARRVPIEGKESAAAYRGHDWALFLNGSLASVVAAARARVGERVGWSSGGRAPFLTVAIRRAGERGGRPVAWERRPRARRALPRPFGADCAELAAQIGIAVRDPRPRIVPSESARERVGARLARDATTLERAPLVVIAAGAREHSAKAVPPARWAAIADALARERDIRCVLLGGPGEEEAVRRTAAALARARADAVLDPPAGLAELAAWAERADLFVCADGGARHVAKAAGARTLVLFGPTDPRHTASDMEREDLVLGAAPCRPCHLERCPLDDERHHACMRSHDPERVAALAARLLGASSA